MKLDENLKNKKIAFIGCGNMASAIIGGLVKAGWPENNIMVSNPTLAKLEKLVTNYQVQITTDNHQAAAFADIIVLSVKPQKMNDVCRHFSSVDLAKKLVISIAAGYQTSQISDNLKQQLAIIRCMPNTPALIGKGATGLFATENVTEQQKNIADVIFQAVGKTSWVEKESQMNIVTAIAGSSPAYFFLMMQSMIEQATDSGLPENVAFDLITQSALGAAQLAQLTTDLTLQKLREQVTSPGGTTAAAIKSFQANSFEYIVKQAVNASIDRGIELGKIN